MEKKLRTNYWSSKVPFNAKRSIQTMLNMPTRSRKTYAGSPCGCSDPGCTSGSPCDGGCGSGESD